MRVLFLTDLFPNANEPSRGIFNLSRAKALHSLGCEVKVVSPVDMVPPRASLLPKPVPRRLCDFLRIKGGIPYQYLFEGFEVYAPRWYRLPRSFFWSREADLLHFFAGSAIRRVVRDFSPDVILSSWLHPYGTYAKYLKRYVDVPVFCFAEGSDVLTMPELYRGWSTIKRTIDAYLDEVILISRAMERVISEKRKFRAQVVVVDGFDEELFRYKGPPPEHGGFQLLSIGNLWPVKGHDLLIKAMPLLSHMVTLTIVGRGESMNDLIELADRIGVLDRVYFPGLVPHEKVVEFIYSADLLCMPSRSDAQPAAALESLACGRPVVATKVGGLVDLIRDGVNGYLADPESPESLAACIDKALDDQWDYEDIAVHAAREFGWKRSVKQVLEYVKEHTGNVEPGNGRRMNP